MPGYRRPPVRMLKLVMALLGATALGADFYRRWGGIWPVLGIVLGGCAGWIIAWWAARELFD